MNSGYNAATASVVVTWQKRPVMVASTAQCEASQDRLTVPGTAVG